MAWRHLSHTPPTVSLHSVKNPPKLSRINTNCTLKMWGEKVAIPRCFTYMYILFASLVNDKPISLCCNTTVLNICVCRNRNNRRQMAFSSPVSIGLSLILTTQCCLHSHGANGHYRRGEKILCKKLRLSRGSLLKYFYIRAAAVDRPSYIFYFNAWFDHKIKCKSFMEWDVVPCWNKKSF